MLRFPHVQLPSRRVALLLAAIMAALLVVAAMTIHQPADRQAGSAVSMDAEASNISAEALVEDAGQAQAGADSSRTTAKMVAPRGIASIAPTEDGAADAATALSLPKLDERIVRTGSISLDVKRRGFEDAWSEAQSIATSRGGYVVSASRSGAGDDARMGTITMRVPSGRFEQALDALRGIDDAKVEGLDVSSQDVTEEYVDVQSRLRHDRAVAARLMTLLADAHGVSEVLAVQSRLDAVQEQIEVQQGRLQYLGKLTQMSTIQVSLQAPTKSGASAHKGEHSTIGAAFSDAAQRFTSNVAATIVWLGGALPTLLILALIGSIAWFTLRRRRSDSASEQGFSE